MELIHECEKYRARLSAETDMPIGLLAFGGIGLGMGGMQIDEFKTASAGRACVAFINDLQRSWWNNDGIESVVSDCIARLRQCGCERVFAIGNSMGGSGALLSSHLSADVSRVYAFVPQADPYGDERWNEYTDNIASVRWPNFADLSLCPDHALFYGIRSPRNPDFRQMTEFERTGRRIRNFEKVQHDLARRLKERDLFCGILGEFFAT